jgi:adenine-specific DNA-methyltransferase
MSDFNEKIFYNALENIFTGAKIEGDSGYINLLKIKSDYYELILTNFKAAVDTESVINSSFKEEFFERLYSFFEKYFSESGSVYFAKTANWQRVYEQVYTDNKDVMLFWKTHMLYYVKTDILFQSMDVSIQNGDEIQTFYFDVGALQNKQNNEKKELVFTYKEIKEGKYIIDVAYSVHGLKTKTDEIGKAIHVEDEIIEKAIAIFKKQASVDFFINKDAKKFLTGQLELYLHQIMLTDENKFDQKRLNQLKMIKFFAEKIIDFIAQFEDELVRIWNKPKFVLGSNYVITLDKLPDNITAKLSVHKRMKEQIAEWEELGMVETGFRFDRRSGEHAHLPVDTRYFKDLEHDILALFENLDDALDGKLIHSENYQVLNSIRDKYKEKIQCIYIDPPFNTGSDFDYIDGYQDSTWLSIMQDRLKLAKDLLSAEGSFYLHLARTSHTGT